jgi:hypothetical protein
VQCKEDIGKVMDLAGDYCGDVGVTVAEDVAGLHH